MDQTEPEPLAEPADHAVPDAGPTPEPAAPPTSGRTPQAAPSPASASDARTERGARRIDAGNTALLIGIIVGLIGSVSVLIGVPVFLLNEQVERARDDIDALADDVSARFAQQDAKIDELAKGQAEIDRKLTALIASLGKTDAVEAALAGDIPP